MMTKTYLVAAAVVTLPLLSSAEAIDASQYSSKAALSSQRSEARILAEETVPRARQPLELASKTWLVPVSRGAAAPAVSAEPMLADNYNSKLAARAERPPKLQFEIAPLK